MKENLSDFLFKKIQSGIVSYQKNNFKHEEDPRQRAGREAEHKVYCDLKNLTAGTNWRIFTKVRIPVSADFNKNNKIISGRREVDFIISSPEQIFILELKNWSGNIYENSHGDVFQERSNGEIVNHGKVFEELNRKSNLLKSIYLEKFDSEPLIQNYVVFYSQKSSLSDSIKNRDDVTTVRNIKKSLPSANERNPFSIIFEVISQLLDSFGFNLKLRSKNQKDNIIKFNELIDKFGSWDVITLNGDAVFYGDLIEDMELICRSKHQSLNIDVDRSVIGNFVASSTTANVTFNTNSIQSVTKIVPLSKKIRFHEAGNKETTDYEIRSIKHIVYGYKEKPKLKFNISDISVGKRMSGVVSKITEKFLRVSIGYINHEGRNFDTTVFITKSNIDLLKKINIGDRVVILVTEISEKTQQIKSVIYRHFSSTAS